MLALEQTLAPELTLDEPEPDRDAALERDGAPETDGESGPLALESSVDVTVKDGEAVPKSPLGVGDFVPRALAAALAELDSVALDRADVEGEPVDERAADSLAVALGQPLDEYVAARDTLPPLVAETAALSPPDADARSDAADCAVPAAVTDAVAAPVSRAESESDATPVMEG